MANAMLEILEEFDGEMDGIEFKPTVVPGSMKQNITKKQVRDLNGDGRKRLLEWYQALSDKQQQECKWDKKSSLPLLSIGQMIEILGDLNWYVNVVSTIPGRGLIIPPNRQLCNRLWGATKEKLERGE